MFDVLIREVGARFGVGDKALPLLQMLLAYMTAKDTGGLMGFLEKFKAAGLGPMVQSWLGGGPAAQAVSNSEVETVLGSSNGLLSQLTAKLGIDRGNAASALGYLIPAVVGKLTPGGSIPATLPSEVTSLAAAGNALLATPVAPAVAASSSSGGIMKWLPWIIVAAAALLGLNYCSKSSTPDTPVTAPASAPEAASSGTVGSFGPDAAPAAPASAPEAASSTAADAASAPPSGSQVAAPSGDEPAGSGVLTWLSNANPALKVYFDSGKTDVSSEFAAKASELVSFLKANADAKAVISGFNDPTGDAAKNAELSKQRAMAVQAALVAAGVPQDQTVLEKPAEATDTSGSNSASRRVEVVVRK